MKRLFATLFVGCAAFAQQANYIILLETSQYTCGQPTQIARQVLREILCSGSYGRVAIGTFYRKNERGYVDWKTTPVLEVGGTPCQATLQTIKTRCDSIYAVHLLGALETALRGDFVQAPEVILLASGVDVTPGLRDADILKLARAKGVRIHALSIGYLTNDDKAQTLLKRLSGQYDEGSSMGLYQLANPQSATYQNIIREFLTSCLSKASASVATSPSKEPITPPSEMPYNPPEADPDEATKSSKPSYTLWILIGAGALVLIGLIIVLSAGKSSPTPPPPPPPPAPQPAPPPGPVVQAPPLPALRRLVIHYPHGTQEVQLPPSPAPISLGRAPDNTIVISDTTVSSRHARLYLQGTQWYIQDLGSTNGTFVNNLRVTQHPVRIGDQIRLGAIVIHVG